MTLFKIIFAALAVILLGAFAFFAFTDIHITPQPVVKEIPHERLVSQNPQ